MGVTCKVSLTGSVFKLFVSEYRLDHHYVLLRHFSRTFQAGLKRVIRGFILLRGRIITIRACYIKTHCTEHSLVHLIQKTYPNVILSNWIIMFDTSHCKPLQLKIFGNLLHARKQYSRVFHALRTWLYLCSRDWGNASRFSFLYIYIPFWYCE